MSLKQRIQEDMKSAMRAREQARLEAIRLLLAAIQRREVDERVVLDDTQITAVIEKMIKQSREAADQFAKGNRQDLVDKEMAGVALWQAYLPERLSEQEIEQLITASIAETGAKSAKDMGKVLGHLKPKVQGRVDMAQVSAKVKTRLAAAE